MMPRNPPAHKSIKNIYTYLYQSIHIRMYIYQTNKTIRPFETRLSFFCSSWTSKNNAAQKPILKNFSESFHMPLRSVALFLFHSKAGECTRIPFLNNGRVSPQESLLSQCVCSEEKDRNNPDTRNPLFLERKREGETAFLGG